MEPSSTETPGTRGTSGWMTGNWLDSALTGEDLAPAVKQKE